jgi:hypothetical protein
VILGRLRPPTRRPRLNDVGRVRLTGGAVLVCLALTASACQPGGPTPSGGGSTTGPNPAAAGSPAAAAADRLAAAIAGLAAGYTFDTTVSVGGQVATHAFGRAAGGASDFVVESNGAKITYRTIPPRSWVKQAGKAWVAVDSGVPDGDPLAALSTPSSLTVTGDDPNALELRADYPPAALGLTGTKPVEVTLTLGSDGSVRATYAVPLGAGSATSATTLTPAPGQEPVVAPSPIATV